MHSVTCRLSLHALLSRAQACMAYVTLACLKLYNLPALSIA